MKLIFYVSKWKFGHNAVIRDIEKEQDIYREDLTKFIGSKLASFLKIKQYKIDEYGFITYKILNPDEILQLLKKYLYKKILIFILIFDTILL